MLSIGILNALFFHTLSMPLFDSTLIHCLILGSGFGVINFLVANWYMTKNAQVKRDNESLKSKVYVDDLTGLLNRKALDLECHNLCHQNFSVLFIDIDNFGAFNNQYGHKVGDHVLHKVGEVIEATVRSGDKAYRYGGEEIVVLLVNCEKRNALQIAEKIRTQVGRINNNPYPSITISIGVAGCPEDGKLVQDILEKSDSALLQAKRLGKNRTFAYDS